MADSEERKKRNVAFEKEINSVSKDDIRVKVVGTVIEKDQITNSVVIDDGQAKVRVLLDENMFNLTDLGRLVRAIGIVAPALEGEGFELRGEILQDFSAWTRTYTGNILDLKKFKFARIVGNTEVE